MKGIQKEPKSRLQHLFVYTNTLHAVIVAFLGFIGQTDGDVLWDLVIFPKGFEVVEMKLFTVHSGSIMNSLSPLALMMDLNGCSSPLSEISIGSAISVSSFVEDEEEADVLLSSPELSWSI